MLKMITAIANKIIWLLFDFFQSFLLFREL